MPLIPVSGQKSLTFEDGIDGNGTATAAADGKAGEEEENKKVPDKCCPQCMPNV